MGYLKLYVGDKLSRGQGKFRFNSGMRMILKYAYLCVMKARLNLTIDNALLEQVKTYAMKQQTSVSELVENYFKAITRSSRRKNIIDMVEKLETPAIHAAVNLKDLYYQEKAKKHGF